METLNNESQAQVETSTEELSLTGPELQATMEKIHAAAIDVTALNLQEVLDSEHETHLGLWYDWFCKDKALPLKTKRMMAKVRKIAKSMVKSGKDLTKYRVYFKNCAPLNGSLYDTIGIVALDNSETYVIAPQNGHAGDDFGNAQVSSHASEGQVVNGTWADVETFFSTLPQA